MTGKIKLYIFNEGYGYIRAGGTDIYIDRESFKGATLAGGTPVEFDMGATPEGRPKAINVREATE